MCARTQPGTTFQASLASKKSWCWCITKHPGCVHTLSIKELKDQGWDVCLKEGMNEFVLVAPSKPGDYKIECLAKCGKGHDDMAMKMTVTG